MNQSKHHRRPLGGGAEEQLPQASRVCLQPQSAQVRPGDRQLHRLLIVQPEDSRGLQRDDADRHRFGERPDHQPELFAALDHAEQRLGAAVADPNSLEPPAQDEADRGEHDVRFVDDAAGWILRDARVPHDLLERLIGHSLEVFVDLQAVG